MKTAACEFCGKINKYTGTRPRRFCDAKCYLKFRRWMVAHRRLIADAVTPCAICGKLVAQHRTLTDNKFKLTCSDPCREKARSMKLKTKSWPRPEPALQRRHVEQIDYRIEQCAQVYRRGKVKKRPCKHYLECLDKEVEFPGEGFQKGCSRFEESSSPIQVTKVPGVKAYIDIPDAPEIGDY